MGEDVVRRRQYAEASEFAVNQVSGYGSEYFSDAKFQALVKNAGNEIIALIPSGTQTLLRLRTERMRVFRENRVHFHFIQTRRAKFGNIVNTRGCKHGQIFVRV